ncbi:hypothetical protein DM01DRAFT_1331764 [Hesseltinella vesiculosa]|uniref:Uncharacterized protein n=1 Tax=Hesseltinella vesiculosa TaxID=101127 RepID=A0A1X2GW95_9FUNG|nr:hypothetical protein DM01DRAFT_1331764 [Hesseltinella vesiculosa]
MEKPPVATNKVRKRQSLPSHLLRRSSDFVKTKWHHWRWSAQPPPSIPIDIDPISTVQSLEQSLAEPPHPITIAVNTTITIPLQRKPSQPCFNTQLLQPPVISHFPPKPLQYAPIVADTHPPQRSVLHRLSMPLLGRSS